MTHTISPRNNFFDGQNITEGDLDTEQNAWHDTATSSIELIAGSGVEQEFSVQRILFDTDDVPASIQTLIDTENFDGTPIYPIDSFGVTVFLQPSDSSQGNQLDITVSDSSLDGSASLKVFVFGTIFGGAFRQEVFTFNDNGFKVTKNYYTEIVAIMTQDFLGNQNNLIDGVASRNNGGRLRISEALPMQVARDTIMVEQSEEPNQDYKNFKPATLFKTLDILLDEISATQNLDKDDLGINLESTTTRNLEPNVSGFIVAEKFQARTNNIQKVTVLLSVEERALVPPGQEFDWTGDIVLGIRKLQTTATCPTDIIPGTPIEFDPEPSPLAEISFDKADLEAIGIVLSDEPQEVDFIFTESLLSNPNIEPSLVPGEYYAITLRRTGNISVGTIVLEEAANTDADPDTVDSKRMSIFAQNVWTDVPDSDLWFKIHTNALRIVNGRAIDAGVQIQSPKVKQNEITNIEEPYIEGGHELIDVSSTAENFVIVQAINEFSDPQPHPSTGNLVFTRIADVPEVSVVSEDTLTTLIDAGNDTIVLGVATDTNPVGNPVINGTTTFPGLQRDNKFTIINPATDILVNNVVGSIITPNLVDPSIKYRIIRKDVYTDLFGDINGDGIVDLADVARAQEIGNVESADGYAKDLESGAVPSAVQVAAVITDKSVSMEEILRADVTGDDIVTIADITAIQQHVALGTDFVVGDSFTRVVLTLENLVDPLNTAVDVPGADPAFNLVPFTDISFRIEFLPLWTEDNLKITDLRRFVPKTFTSIEASDISGDDKSGGTNSFFVPGDLLLGGELLDGSGEIFSVDLEVNTVILELPEGETEGEIDVFNSFIKNQMQFSDGSLVSSSGLSDGQVKVAAAIQSYTKDLDGYDIDTIDGYSSIDESISILYTQSTGLLRIRANNVRNILTRPELRTKIILTVYLKKAGFINTEQVISGANIGDFLTPLI